MINVEFVPQRKAMEPASVKTTSTPKEKPKRNYVEQFLPFYKKSGEGETAEDWIVKDRTSNQTYLDYIKPKRTPGKWQKKQNQSVDSSILADSNNSPNKNTSPRDKVTSTPLAGAKKSSKIKNSKKNISELESNNTAQDLSLNVSKKSNKRNKSVSFLLEENNEIVVKRPKSDISNDTESEDTPRKEKNKKKKKLGAKENMEIDNNLEVPIKKNKKKSKSIKSTSETEADPQLFGNKNDFKVADEGQNCKDNEVKEKKNKKQKLSETQDEKEKAEEPMVKKKAKKLKHQSPPESNEGEPASKTTKVNIASNLEKLSLGDNPHTLTNLINEMAVVDSAKKKKIKKDKIKKQLNSDNKSQETGGETPNEPDSEAAGDKVPKKWEKKRWNKKNKGNSENKSLNIDNIPVSLLKGNYKKLLIDHFSEFGENRGIGEAYTVDEKVFSTKIYFDTTEAAKKALERNGSSISGNEIIVSEVRPRTETTIVIRVYAAPEKLTNKDLLAVYKEIGIIRSIQIKLHKKKTMTTAFVEFESEAEVQAALEKSSNLLINGAKVKVDKFIVRTTAEKEPVKKKINKKRKKSKKLNGNSTPMEIKHETENQSEDDESD